MKLFGETKFEATITVAMDPERAADLLGSIAGARCLTVERRIHRPGPRCLWGWRRGFKQVGSPEDADDVLRLTVPRANLEITGV